MPIRPHYYTPIGGYLEPYQGRCSTCGFLAKRPSVQETPTNDYYEVPMEDRLHGTVFHHTRPWGPGKVQHGTMETEPVCFTNKAWLLSEIDRKIHPGHVPTPEERRKAAVEVITSDRHCEGWFPYQPSRTPKEHYEEQRESAAQEDRRKFDTAIANRHGRIQKVSIAIAVAQALVAIVALLLQPYLAPPPIVNVYYPTPTSGPDSIPNPPPPNASE